MARLTIALDVRSSNGSYEPLATVGVDSPADSEDWLLYNHILRELRDAFAVYYSPQLLTTDQDRTILSSLANRLLNMGWTISSGAPDWHLRLDAGSPIVVSRNGSVVLSGFNGILTYINERRNMRHGAELLARAWEKDPDLLPLLMPESKGVPV